MTHSHNNDLQNPPLDNPPRASAEAMGNCIIFILKSHMEKCSLLANEKVKAGRAA